jgi:hypothetical protein
MGAADGALPTPAVTRRFGVSDIAWISLPVLFFVAALGYVWAARRL